MASLLAADTSPALQAASEFLAYLQVADPPVTTERVLDGLGLATQPLPAFDLERLTPEQLRQFRAIRGLRGLLSPAERKIYVSSDLHARRYPWFIYHESGHALIPWHREALYLDNDYRLSRRVVELMEKEANEFAGHLQFLGPRFAAEANDLPFGLDAAIALADRYETSYESAIHHYVATREENCVCLVFDVVAAETEARILIAARTLRYRYFIRSRSRAGRWQFDYSSREVLPLDDDLVRVLNEGKLSGGAVYHETFYHQATKTAYGRQVFSNGHSVFELVRMV